ncbi:uncharacterized protein LOC119724727 isoform X2 [Patiria miniata]|nr:uncharacterized protein LOC119724727 isoform X2 [Patiria miniata]
MSKQAQVPMAKLQVLLSSFLVLLLRPDIVETQANFGQIEDVDIQLIDGSAPNEGRVLIRWSPDSPWIVMCYTDLPTAAAWQMCRRAGYSFACGYSEAGARRTNESSLVNVTSQVWSVSGCFYNQDSIFDGGCSLQLFELFGPGAGPTCSHDNDLWLTCGYPGMPDFELRQVDETFGPGNRLVQARCGPDNEWSALCGNLFFPLKEGKVVCRELGHADEALSNDFVTPDRLAPQHRPNFTLFVDYGCIGDETSLTECLHYALRECTSYVALECFTGVEGYNNTGYLCGSKQLCGDECQQQHPINGSHDYIFHYCQCDDACSLFDDCCYDYADMCGPEPPRLERGEFTIDDFGCVWVTGSQFTHIGYVAVDRCPITWTDEPTRDLCERPVDAGDVIGSLLLHDDQGVDFKNIYCAICNGRSYDRLTPWEISAAGNTRSSSIMYYPSLGMFLPAKGWVIKPPQGHPFIRECPAHLVDTCLEEFHGTNIEKGCKAYYAPIKIGDGDTRYRNPHCVMCNGLKVVADNSCSDQVCSHSCEPTHWTNCSSICGPIDNIFTIEVLFDFTSSNSITGTSCSVGQIYDPFLGRCRVLTCTAGYHLVSNECVITTFYSQPSINSSEAECMSETLGVSLGRNLFAAENLPGASGQSPATTSVFLVLNFPAEVFDFEAAFDGAAEAMQNASLVDSALVCNISKLSVLLPFTFNSSNLCSKSTVVVSDLAPRYNGTLLNALEYQNIGLQYSKTKAFPLCLEMLDLNCSSLLSLDNSEYKNLSNDIIQIAATGSSLSPEEYVLFPDGTAVVCSFLGPVPEGLEPYIRRVISFIGSCLSLFALAATFLTYCVFSELRKLAGKLVMNLVVALFTAILMFMIPGYLSPNPTACVIGAMVAHFAWLAAFAFMAIVAVNVERTLTSLVQRREKPSGVSRTLVAYMALGWGLPLIVVGICLILQFCNCTSLPKIYAEGAVCWITNSTVRVVVFVVPVGISLIVSTGLYLLTLVRLRRRRRATQIVRKQGRVEGAREELAIYSKLCVLMGVTWIFGFVSQSVTGILVFSYIYILLNYLQGVFIFIAFCLNKRVRGLWKEQLRGRKVKPKKEAASDPKQNTQETNVPPTVNSVGAPAVLEENTKL